MTSENPSRGLHVVIPVASLIALVLLFVAIRLLGGDEATANPLERGVEWIAARQHQDGAWRGEEIAVLRPGPAMTAFVLYAFTRLPPALRPARAEIAARGFRYLESRIDADGTVGLGSEGPDYPTYATSLAVIAFAWSRPAGWESLVARMVAYLKRAQLDESEGWTPEDREYGGWAFGGPPQPKPGAHRLDISMTRFALEALAVAGVPESDPVWSKARRFLETCQNDDGGFDFTALPAQSKAGNRVSYGTATADGLLSLRFAAGPQDRIVAAESWIRSRFTAERCPGFPPDHPRPWADALFGYWAAAAGRVADAPARTRLAQALVARQRPDGSWSNAVDLMLENEPLLATTLAVLALSEAAR